jgi:8-oxo-dGTP pyrophosphatase MutT (NUDIX family)
MMTENQTFEVSLKTILKNNEDEILLLENAKTSWMYGYYDFPGGRVQQHETGLELHEIAKRELIEEVGDINFKISDKPVSYGRHRYRASNGETIQVLWIFFEARYLNGDVEISSEHVGFKWMKLDQINIDKCFPKDTGGYNGIRNYIKWQNL